MNAPNPVIPTSPSAAEPAPAPCLIVNPRSFRAAAGGLAARAIALGEAYGAEVLVADQPAQISAGLDRALAAGPRPIFILSGDGTVQALMDDLAARFAGSTPPPLLVLGGGRSNLTAADVGGRGDLLRKLEAALSRCRSGAPLRLEQRQLLVIEQAPAPARHGFFVAGGLIDDAIRDCHRHRETGRGPLRRGHVSTGWYLSKLALLALLGRSPLKATDLRIEAPGCGALHGGMAVFIASTLEHRRGLFNPYAARGQGAVRVTAITSGAPRFWRSLPAILRGRFGKRMTPADGYLSGRCDQLEVLGLRGYSLDGEAFDADPSRPVIFRAGAVLGFVQP